jgi:hypothetical protein
MESFFLRWTSPDLPETFGARIVRFSVIGLVMVAMGRAPER